MSLLLSSSLCVFAEERSDLPNIVWIISEDMGPDLGCWGTKVRTPNIDRLAGEGMRFTKVFGTASVCMPNRTAMITGVTQTTLGSVTMRPPEKFMRALPEGISPLPNLLREKGYYTANVRNSEIGSSGKNDWNFKYDGKGWDSSKLSDLKPSQPFYAQFNIQLAHRPFKRDKEHPIDPDTVVLPPYYPDHPVSRRSWADYLESIQHLDRKVGKVLAWLDQEGLSDSTVVFFLSDHGEAFLRGKYYLYDCSLNQPLIIRWPTASTPPPKYQCGTTSNQMLAAIDITAQTAACAGASVPTWMHGREFLSGNSQAREAVYSAADWIGGSKIKSRSVRTKRFKYIRNYNPELSVHNGSSEYRKAMHPLYHLVEILQERGELSEAHQRLLLDPLPREELYDLESDPHEMLNLAADSAHAELKARMRADLESWIIQSNDLGFEILDPQHAAFFDNYRKSNAKRLRKQQQKLRAAVLSAVVDNSNDP